MKKKKSIIRVVVIIAVFFAFVLGALYMSGYIGKRGASPPTPGTPAPTPPAPIPPGTPAPTPPAPTPPGTPAPTPPAPTPPATGKCSKMSGSIGNGPRFSGDRTKCYESPDCDYNDDTFQCFDAKGASPNHNKHHCQLVAHDYICVAYADRGCVWSEAKKLCVSVK